MNTLLNIPAACIAKLYNYLGYIARYKKTTNTTTDPFY